MTTTTARLAEIERLRHSVPAFDPDRGDLAVEGIERALSVATARARRLGLRYVVTCSPYGRMPDSDAPVMRVQVWR